MCGPISAAWVHNQRIEVGWDKPVCIRLLDVEVNVLTTPPRQVQAILQAHARRHVDLQLISRLCKEYEWNEHEVMELYRHGIDWPLLRAFLNDTGGATAHERKALAIVVTGGFWPEDRRHAKNMRGSPLCAACGAERGTARHRLHDCLAMLYDSYSAEAHGRLPRPPRELSEPAWAPLACMGLPPKPRPWAPAAFDYEEGHVPMDVDISTFGDGSGYKQSDVEGRVATWAIVRTKRIGNNKWVATHRRRGTVGGWFPTVPRGELKRCRSSKARRPRQLLYWRLQVCDRRCQTRRIGSLAELHLLER